MRLPRWIGIGGLAMWAAGCREADPDAYLGTAASHRPPTTFDGSATFRMTTGVVVPIMGSLPVPATVHLRVRNSVGADLLSVTHLDFPAMDHGYVYGLRNSDSGGSETLAGHTSILPRGDFTVEAFAPDASPLPLSCGYTPAAGTRTITLLGNLDSVSDSQRFDASSPEETSNLTATLTLWTTLGVAFPATIYFVNDEPGASHDGSWTYHVFTDGKYLSNTGTSTPAIPGEPFEIAAGELRFSAAGQLASHTPDPKRMFVPVGTITAQPLLFVFQRTAPSPGAEWERFTHLPRPSEVRLVEQDGHGAFVHCAPLALPDGVDPADLSPLPRPTLPPPQAIIQPIVPPTRDRQSNDSFIPPTPTTCVCKRIRPPEGAEVASHVPPAGESASQTKELVLHGILDVLSPPAPPFDLANPRATSSLATDVTVVGVRGNEIPLTVYFSKQAWRTAGDSGDWRYYVVGSALDLETGEETPPTAPVLVASGLLRFDSAGALISNTETMNTFHPKGANHPQKITFNFGTGTEHKGSGLDGITQYATTPAMSDSKAVAAFPPQCTIAGAPGDPTAFGCWQVVWP